MGRNSQIQRLGEKTQRSRDLGERLKILDLGDRLKSRKNWVRGSEIPRLGVRLKDRDSGMETQRHRDMEGRLRDTENQMGRLRTIGTYGETQRYRVWDVTQIYRLAGGTHTQNYRESEEESQSYMDLGVETQRLDTWEDTQR